MNLKKRIKCIATYYFSVLYTKLPHDQLKSKLDSIFDFAFKGGDKTFIILSYNGADCRGKKTKEGLGFSKTSLKTAINHLIKNCYFNIATATMKQEIGIWMRIDSAPFWINIFLYSYEEEYMSWLIFSDKIQARHFQSTNRLIDDLCAINPGGIFGISICEIYPK